MRFRWFSGFQVGGEHEPLSRASLPEADSLPVAIREANYLHLPLINPY